MIQTTFKAKILASLIETPSTKEGASISHIIAKLARGEMKVTMPYFIDEPTIILEEIPEDETWKEDYNK